MGSGRQEAGEEAEWVVVAGEDVECGACDCGKCAKARLTQKLSWGMT